MLSSSKKNYVDYIDSFYDYCSDTDNKDSDIKAIEVKESMINDIINSSDEINVEGTAYYVSNSGNDSFDGTSPDTPICSMERLEEISEILKDGDAVLFERGSSWRICEKKCCIFSARPGVSYGAYGEGKKPCFIGSVRNYANAEYWKETECENVYVCVFPFLNAGVVALDHTESYGNYNDPVATKKMFGFLGFEGIKDLSEDCSYYNDVETEELFFYSSKGNPGERFSSIEIGGRGAIINNQNAKCIDNLEFKFSGYGIINGTSMNVTNCIFRYIGGCMLENKKGSTRVCGNAVEICGCCDGFSVRNCWIYQMCDTAVSHQFWIYEGGCAHRNIEFTGNVMEYCYWTIEFNNPKPNDNSFRIVENVTHSYNYLGMGGYGFGGRMFAREGQATLYNSFGTAKTKNFVCEKNILYRCAGSLYRTNNAGDSDILYRRNINFQDRDKWIAFINFKDNAHYNREGIKKFFEVTKQNDSIYLNL